jgi:hypothetical protein
MRSFTFTLFLPLPSQYVQLHRDTTLSSLTSLPSLQDGKIVSLRVILVKIEITSHYSFWFCDAQQIFEDSPLVRAAKLGRVFVVDEADKAPLEVSCCLKGLVEGRD